ncbi:MULTISPECIES: L,D-transpeptidase family protein [Azorhizobium]|uniref:L,D-transpeptidase family protein n=3 Tax=Xanthobacteraceae TaxID=335928 RepID=UPI0010CFEEC4|nr:murein L,D-transpeptidase family protein [Azorhizobium sp. AG788]TDT93769.1 murein L,D-transpeptidase YafK [Azorhizobium sp. AG788]
MSRPLAILSRVRLAALAAVAALALAACNGQGNDVSAKANQPLSPKMISLMSEKDMAPQNPILIRVFKEEAELEVWKAKNDGSYALLKTYPICRWSGELGPKVKIGDRQAPEGFYMITPGLMNPNSSYYLSINTGFPNAFDKSWGRTGEFLMIHGDCSSAGCYAMTDEQIAEIFALAREAFAGGQRAFQIQAMPFRMTPQNLARHRNNPNMAFWRNLKQGYDHFEVTKHEPKVNVCNRQYVFDAQLPPGQAFNPSAPCPAYTVAPEIASAVGAKERSDNLKVAELSSNTPLAPVRTGRDGGMNPVFLAKLNGEDNAPARMAYGQDNVPAFDPANVRPPKADGEVVAAPVRPGAPAATPAPAPVASTPARAASTPYPNGTAAPTAGSTSSLYTRATTQTASADTGVAQASALMGAAPIVGSGGFGN